MPELKIDDDAFREMVVKRCVEQLLYEHDLDQAIADEVKRQAREAIGKGLQQKVDAVLDREMEQLLQEEVVPTTIWGEAAGKPTTIKAALHERAKDYWEVRVDKDGKPSSYSGRPRYEQMFKNIVREEFAEAIKQNSVNIIGAFKDALRASQHEQIDKHLNELLRVQSATDRKR